MKIIFISLKYKILSPQFQLFIIERDKILTFKIIIRHKGKNSSCVNLLKLHCVYVYVLAINGVTESFFNATMNNLELQNHNKRLISFSIIFLFLALILSKLFEIYGFLLANIINMIVRIFFSCSHIKTVFDGFVYGKENFISSVQKYNVLACFLPDVFIFVWLLISLFSTLFSEFIFYENYKIIHLAIGALTFLTTLFIIYKRETELKKFVLKFIKNNQKIKSQS